MQSIIETPNLGPVAVSRRVTKHFSKFCDEDSAQGTSMVEDVLRSTDIERIEVPAAIAALIASKIDDPNALEFWVHRESSTVFLVKARENCRYVEMAMKTSMAVFEFENPKASP